MNKKIVKAIISAVCAALLLTACGEDKASQKSQESKAEESSIENSEAGEDPEPEEVLSGAAEEESRIEDPVSAPAYFELTVLDVGEGLSVLIRSGDHYALYDGGGRGASSFVVSYLKERGIEHLDFVFVSHYDEDHLSGIIGVMRTTQIGTLVAPSYEADSDIYMSYNLALTDTDANVKHPLCGDVLLMGKTVITVIGPSSFDSEKENNRSLAIKVQCENFAAVLTGDAEAEEEADILETFDVSCDVYVAGHHGSSTSTSDAFLNAMDPAYVIISAGENNDFGHPHAETIQKIADRHIEALRTDELGHITMFYASGKITVSHEKPTPVTEEEVIKFGGYVLNKSSMTIHLPTCDAVGKMNEENKVYTLDDLGLLLEEGYAPCGGCRPDND